MVRGAGAGRTKFASECDREPQDRPVGEGTAHPAVSTRVSLEDRRCIFED